MSASELLADSVDSLEQAVEDGMNVAVVSEPHAGRGEILRQADFDEAERVSLGSVAEAEAFDASYDSGICVVEGCEYLYKRVVDGLTPLEDFVESVASSEATYVTTWNTYAWSYAVQAAHVGDVIPESVEAPTLGADETARLLASEYDISEFADDYEEVVEEEYDDLRERLPDSLRFGIGAKSDNVFEKISATSRGNIGVARSVYEGRTWKDDHDDLDLSYDDAFALAVVVSKERIDRDVLQEVVVTSSLGRTLRKLSNTGVIEHGDTVSIRPQRLVDAVDHLGRRRLVW